MASYTESCMDDWQGCLSPQCQTALVDARENVDQRGGVVITAEDFLLSLLDSCSSLTRFLCSRGVDIDELTRTVQCEQPIVTEVGGEGLLSSQLIYWFATARQVCDLPWLDWPVLLEVLAHKSERLQEKAYVAVLELVSVWPGADGRELAEIDTHNEAPIVVADTHWVELCDDVAITLSASASAMVWVRGQRGTGKSAWLQSMRALLEPGYVQIDPRREADLFANDLPAVPANIDGRARNWPVLILDNTSPADLLALISHAHSPTRALVTNWEGAILLVGPDCTTDDADTLEQLLGRAIDVFNMPAASTVQRKAILIAHQGAIEKRWNIELPLSTIEYAVTRRSQCVSSPGGMLRWVERAAARLDLFARRGPAETQALADQCDTLRRQSLVALARNEPVDTIESALRELQVVKAASEISWRERKAAGILHRLSVEDLSQELERWVAARSGPVHYVRHCDNENGDITSAGSGNIYS